PKITFVATFAIGTPVILGQDLVEQGYGTGYHPEEKEVYVKAPVFSFAKLRSVDTTLGPEMKSTGEVMGKDLTLEKALYKGLVASSLSLSATVMITDPCVGMLIPEAT
ncbi:hypothetical protein ACT453_39545, partial [Bacillus sp. D-CC]